jgi:hypothetical protein
MLAASSADGTIRLWTVRAASLKELACKLVGRELTSDEQDEFIGPDQSHASACLTTTPP